MTFTVLSFAFEIILINNSPQSNNSNQTNLIDYNDLQLELTGIVVYVHMSPFFPFVEWIFRYFPEITTFSVSFSSSVFFKIFFQLRILLTTTVQSQIKTFYVKSWAEKKAKIQKCMYVETDCSAWQSNTVVIGKKKQHFLLSRSHTCMKKYIMKYKQFRLMANSHYFFVFSNGSKEIWGGTILRCIRFLLPLKEFQEQKEH